MATLSDAESQIETIACLLLPLPLPELLPIGWQLDQHRHTLEAALVFRLRY